MLTLNNQDRTAAGTPRYCRRSASIIYLSTSYHYNPRTDKFSNIMNIVLLLVLFYFLLIIFPYT